MTKDLIKDSALKPDLTQIKVDATTTQTKHDFSINFDEPIILSVADEFEITVGFTTDDEGQTAEAEVYRTVVPSND